MSKNLTRVEKLFREFVIASHDYVDAIMAPAPRPSYDTLSRPVPLAIVPDEGRKQESVDETVNRLRRIARKMTESMSREDAERVLSHPFYNPRDLFARSTIAARRVRRKRS